MREGVVISPSILIITEGNGHASILVRRLEIHGCKCQFSTSFQDASRLIGADQYDLVLAPVRLRDGTVYGLMEAFIGTHTTVFGSHVVGDNCWWIPILRQGQECLEEGALRASEFVPMLDEVVAEINASRKL